MGDRPDTNSLADVDRVRAILIDSARVGESISYSRLLAELGHRFTRPKMRAVCKTLDVVDDAAIATGEPELAVLVVRESDGLPGQGWWGGARSFVLGHDGPWTGPVAARLVREQQDLAFAWWRDR